jgi:SAM-dependent methyltransferase
MATRKLTLVDVGSGYGVLAELTAGIIRSPLSGLEDVFDFEMYVAVDVNPKLLQQAVHRAMKLGIRARGYVFDLDTGEGERPGAGIGDIVVLAFVLTHLAGADVGLREAARLAKANGVVLVIDTAYATAMATGDVALAATIASIRRRLRHRDFDHLDEIAAAHGLRRLSGLDDVRQRFGAGDLSAKHDALGFVGNFAADDEARVAWERISGGVLLLTQVRRAYVMDEELTRIVKQGYERGS